MTIVRMGQTRVSLDMEGARSTIAEQVSITFAALDDRCMHMKRDVRPGRRMGPHVVVVGQ
jgi:hypothetical protein